MAMPVDGQRGRQRRELDLGLGRLLRCPLPQPLDVAGRADPVRERVDGAGQVLPGALDLGDDLV